jgi:hypothetical protein
LPAPRSSALVDETELHGERVGRWSWLRLAVVDTRPLRRREFRLLFLSRSVSFAGARVKKSP